MKSKVIKVNKIQNSVRVNIPQGVKDILNIEAGDYIEWNPEVKDGNIVFVVTRSEEK
jgi:antitoxin component of MazEF toxin-antitoxin module